MRNYFAILVIMLTTTTSYGQTWIKIDTIRLFNSITLRDVCFINDSVGFIANKNKLYKTKNQGVTWEYVRNNAPFQNATCIQLLNSNLGFVGNFTPLGAIDGFYMTEDGGTTIKPVTNSNGHLIPAILGIHYKDSVLLAVGGNERNFGYINKSMDFGKTWKSLHFEGIGVTRDCQILDRNTYVVSGMNTGNKACVYKANDGGLNWKKVISTNTSATFCRKIHINENGIGLASVQDLNQVQVTSDFGETWDIVANNGDSGVLFFNDNLGWVGYFGDKGCQETKDNGKTWNYNPTGRYLDKIVKINDHIAIAVGIGVYRYNSRTMVTENPINPTLIKHSLSINPNPSTSQANINVHLINNTFLIVDIIDIKANKVTQIFKGAKNAGDHKFNVATSSLKSGNYVVCMRTN